MTREERIAHIESKLGGAWRGMISASSLIWLLNELRTADEKLAVAREALLQMDPALVHEALEKIT